MENISKTDLKFIMNVYKQIEKNTFINSKVNEAYDKLPEHLRSTIITPNGKIMAINRFVIMNFQDIEATLKDKRRKE